MTRTSIACMSGVALVSMSTLHDISDSYPIFINIHRDDDTLTTLTLAPLSTSSEAISAKPCRNEAPDLSRIIQEAADMYHHVSEALVRK